MAGFGRFLLRRLLGTIVLVWATTVAAFVLLRVGPPSASMDAQISQQLGAGQPATEQYVHYLLRLLHGGLGTSLTEGVSVDSILRNALPPTLSLMVGGTVLWLTAGVVAGTVSALRPGSAADRIATGGVLTGLAVPTFLLALLLLWLSSRLGEAGHLWFQPGYVPFRHSPGQWLGRMIPPWIAVAAGQAAVTARLTRAGILEVLGEDYVRTARGKGLAERRIVWFTCSARRSCRWCRASASVSRRSWGRRPSSTRCSRSAGSGRRSWWRPKPGT